MLLFRIWFLFILGIFLCEHQNIYLQMSEGLLLGKDISFLQDAYIY